jgi:hypothetical protein
MLKKTKKPERAQAELYPLLFLRPFRANHIVAIPGGDPPVDGFAPLGLNFVMAFPFPSNLVPN